MYVLYFKFIVLLLLLGCSQKKETAVVRPFIQKTFLAASSQLGGVMVYGLSEGGQSFALALDDENVRKSVTLPKEKWNFYAIGWEGPDKLSGTVRCAVRKDEALSGDSLDLNLTLSTAGCEDYFFGSGLYKTLGQFHPLSLFSCSSVSTISNYSETCSSIRGGAMSYRVTMLSYPLQSIGTTANMSTGLDSSCLNVTSSAGTLSTGIRPPAGAGALTPFKVLIKAYSASDCGGTEKIFAIYQGLGQSLADKWIALAAPSATHMYLNTGFTPGNLWGTALWGQGTWQ